MKFDFTHSDTPCDNTRNNELCSYIYSANENYNNPQSLNIYGVNDSLNYVTLSYLDKGMEMYKTSIQFSQKLQDKINSNGIIASNIFADNSNDVIFLDNLPEFNFNHSGYPFTISNLGLPSYPPTEFNDGAIINYNLNKKFVKGEKIAMFYEKKKLSEMITFYDSSTSPSSNTSVKFTSYLISKYIGGSKPENDSIPRCFSHSYTCKDYTYTYTYNYTKEGDDETQYTYTYSYSYMNEVTFKFNGNDVKLNITAEKEISMCDATDAICNCFLKHLYFNEYFVNQFIGSNNFVLEYMIDTITNYKNGDDLNWVEKINWPEKTNRNISNYNSIIKNFSSLKNVDKTKFINCVEKMLNKNTNTQSINET